MGRDGDRERLWRACEWDRLYWGGGVSVHVCLSLGCQGVGEGSV